MAFGRSRAVQNDVNAALDPDTPKADLVKLAAHKSHAVKAVVAARADCPLAAMLSLVQEEDPRILEALATNPSAPKTVLQVLLTSRSAEIRDMATRRLRLLAV